VFVVQDEGQGSLSEASLTDDRYLDIESCRVAVGREEEKPRGRKAHLESCSSRIIEVHLAPTMAQVLQASIRRSGDQIGRDVSGLMPDLVREIQPDTVRRRGSVPTAGERQRQAGEKDYEMCLPLGDREHGLCGRAGEIGACTRQPSRAILERVPRAWGGGSLCLCC